MYFNYVLALVSLFLYLIKPSLSLAQTFSIERTATPILVDGDIDQQWSYFKFENIQNISSGTISSSNDLSSSFKVIADDENLYFLLQVRDDVFHSDNESDIWNDDGLEIFLDVDNDKNATYGINDFQFQIRYNDATVHESKHNKTTNTKIGQRISGDTITYELSIPFSTIGLDFNTMVDGLLIGFDIHINDDDKGTREGKLAWYGRTDEASKNPAYFGTAQFIGFSKGQHAGLPKFSHERGFYNSPFDLTVSTTTNNASIHYTLDGSDPRFSSTAIVAELQAIINIDPESTTDRGGKTPGVIVRAVTSATDMSFSEILTYTYLFPSAIASQSVPGGDWAPVYTNFAWPGYNNPQNIDYAMSTSITGSTQWGSFEEALKDIPTYSLVTDYGDMFDKDRGIYMNALTDGWERPVSVEMIDPIKNESFQINAGIRIRGRYSRLPRNAKHSFRLLFRNEYGDGSLDYPVFEDEGTDKFDRLDFRTAQNSSWQTEESHSTVTFLKEVFARDASGKMGLEYTKSRYCHLYLNGMYWGLYQIQERAEENFAETYFGGSKSDYDVIKPEKDVVNPPNDLKVGAKEGTMESAARLWNKVLSGMSSNEAYFEVQGMNADGTRNTSYERLLDVENLIDYLLVSFYTGSEDGPGVTWISLWGRMLRPNNFIGIYNRANPDGFKWIVHDFEKTMYDKNESWPLLESDDSWFKEDLEFINPVTIHRKLMANEEYRQKFGDRVYRHFENGGVFTKDSVQAIFNTRKAQIQLAVIAEAARWGDMVSWLPANTPDNWENNVNNLFNNYIPFRTDIVLDQFRTLGVYNDIKAPLVKHDNKDLIGTELRANESVALSLHNLNSSGEIYYTLDGSDPRKIGGFVSNMAVIFNGSDFNISASRMLKARVKQGDNWSPLLDVKFIVTDSYEGFKITEINYNPPATSSTDGQELEFLEFKNTSNTTLNLANLSINDGVVYQFAAQNILPGEFVVLAANASAFSSKYGFQPDGVFTGQLRNSGETITVSDIDGNLIIEVSYSDDLPWIVAADGGGPSLVSVEINPIGDPKMTSYWRASTKIGGSPNADDPSPTSAEVIVNEVLSNGSGAQEDAIELYNMSSTTTDISGWYLTDDRNEPTKWKIPASTTIPSNSYLSFDATQFSFGLSTHGEEVFLFAANASGELTGYSHGVKFGEVDEGVSIGTHTTSTNETFFVALESQTFGAINDNPKIGPVIFNTIMYHPSEGLAEYLELKNISDQSISFNGPNNESSTWKIEGIGFQFPRDITIAPGASLYIIETDIMSENFRSTYGVSAQTTILNMEGSLDNAGETISLYKPGPEYTSNAEATFEYILVEKVKYNDKAPWPIEADGSGAFLARKEPIFYSNDPSSWEPTALLLAPLLLPDEINTQSGNDVSITFTDDPDWRSAISVVKVNSEEISSDGFMEGSGVITISGDYFVFKQDYEIIIASSGYYPSIVIQSILTGEEPPMNILNSTNLKMFPNPVVNQLTIANMEPGRKLIRFLDLSGKVCLSKVIDKSEHILSLEGLKPGVYLISISQNGTILIENKIVKQ